MSHICVSVLPSHPHREYLADIYFRYFLITPHLLLWSYIAFHLSQVVLTSFIVWTFSPFISTDCYCHLIPHSSSLFHVSAVHALPDKTKTTAPMSLCVCAFACACPISRTYVFLCVLEWQWVTVSNGPDLKMGVQLLSMCLRLARETGLCVCLHTKMVTVERELGCAALCSILMPLSLLGFVPFLQLSLRPTSRWMVRVKGETSRPYTGDDHPPLTLPPDVDIRALNIKIKERTWINSTFWVGQVTCRKI